MRSAGKSSSMTFVRAECAALRYFSRGISFTIQSNFASREKGPCMSSFLDPLRLVTLCTAPFAPLAFWAVCATPTPAPSPSLPAATSSAGSPCNASAIEAYEASLRQAKADYFNQRAACSNITLPALRAQCDFETKAALIEAVSDCKEQKQARLEVCDQVGHGFYDPPINPANFVAAITNPLMPLTPGNHWVYNKTTTGGIETTDLLVLPGTKQIMGVTCTIVHDVTSVGGQVQEDTFDWFAQDVDGNVWYFGEISVDYEDGELVSVDGSWKAGVDGAKPGIVMPAVPQVGKAYRQEFLVNEAEDVFEIQALNSTVDVPFGNFVNCLETLDTTPIEPGHEELKYYYPGVGRLLEVSVNSGSRSELISFTTN